MDDAVSALIEVLRECEEEPKKVKQEYMENFNLNKELKKMSIPAKYKGPIQKLMDGQANVLTSRLAVAFKGQIKLVLLYFFNNNPDVNGYAIDVEEMLTRDIVAHPEDNLTNQLMDTEIGHVSELANLEVKVEEMNQESTEVVLSPVVSSNDLELQPSTPSHSNDEEIIPAINQLPQLVSPVLGQNINNRAEVIEPPVHISKKDMWKKLPLNPPTCLVKDCGTKFDYSRIRQDHIEKDHQNTRVWHCALCTKHYTTYTTLDGHFQKEHAFYNYQCTFPSCAFTSKTKRQVTKHFEECHIVSAIVNNPENKYTNQDRDDDDDLSEHQANLEENANVQPINQGSTPTVPFPVASGSDGPNELPVVQQPSTSAKPKTMKRTPMQSTNNEECNAVYVAGQGQSSSSAKKAKLDAVQSDHAESHVTSQSEQTIEGRYNPTKEGLQKLDKGKMAIWLGLNCFQLDCEKLFRTEKQLNYHMQKKHHIRAFPCLVKGCSKSFDDKRSRNDHAKRRHKDLSECAKCFDDCKTLSLHGLPFHYTNQHSALYQCSFASCTFTSNQTYTIYNHFVQEHTTTCIQNACANKLEISSFKRTRRIRPGRGSAVQYFSDSSTVQFRQDQDSQDNLFRKEPSHNVKHYHYK